MDAAPEDPELWYRLHCLAFDDVMGEVCDLAPGEGPGMLGESRRLAAEFLQALTRRAPGGAAAVLGGRAARLLRGTLLVRFGERILYWMERLPAVEAEYGRRVRLLRGRTLGPEALRPFLDRGDGRP